MIFPCGAIEEMMNFYLGRTMMYLLSILPSLALGSLERALGGVLVFLDTYRIL